MQKAGNNYLLAVGKLVGSQVKAEGKDRERTTDIFTPYPRTYEYTVMITLPEGYTPDAESLEQLRVNASNDCGRFVSEATMYSNTLKLTVNKCFERSYEPVANWGKLLEIIDAGNEFSEKVVVLRK